MSDQTSNILTCESWPSGFCLHDLDDLFLFCAFLQGYRQAVLTKNTRLGEDAANRPQSAAVISPTKKHKHQELHLAQEGREELFHK
jgi:hypothetical protein